MRADTLRGQAGGGWALEIESFLGSVKWHRADRRVGGIGTFSYFLTTPTNLAGPVSCPAKFGSRYGTEDTPLVISEIEDGFIYSILMKNGTFPFK